MRSFILSCILFALVIVFISLNGRDIAGRAERMSGLLRDLPAAAEEADAELIRRLREEWESWEPLLHLTVRESRVAAIAMALDALETGAAAGDDAQYGQGKADLAFFLRQLKESEGASFSGIL